MLVRLENKMALLGKEIRLQGISQKGKNRIRQHGDRWMVLAETDKILFNPNRGPWLFISPPGKMQNDKASRWIHGQTDPDFQIV